MFFARKKRMAALQARIDDLGAVRDQMRALRVREEALREEIMSYRPNEFEMGTAYEMMRKTRRKKRFDMKLLPQHIREDRAYWRWAEWETLTLTPLDSSQMAANAANTAQDYADLEIPEPVGEADYGRRMSPDPDQPIPYGADEDLEWMEAAEPTAPFDWEKKE
ncbi:hypothetical protein ACS3SW_05620 [Roseobacteraceae bacterium S113]